MSKKDIDEIIAELQDDRIAASSALSTQTRTIALGVLALAWLLLSGTEDSLTKFASYSTQLLCIAGLSVLALLFDYAQYIFTLWETDSALKASLGAQSVDAAGYDEKCRKRTAANVSFFLKIFVVFVAAAWILLVMLRVLSAT